MSRSYNLNAEQAKGAESRANRITESGQYTGRFTRAESVTSKKNTEGVEFAFEAENGQSADFLNLWTYNVDGKELFGLKMLNAIMTCMRVKTLTPQQAQVEKWSQEADGKVKVVATVYPDLMNKSIGLLLQKEAYAKQDGSVGYKFNVYGCFEPGTGMVASEILEKASKGEKLGRIAATLKDKPLDGSAPRAAAAPVATAGAFSDMDDDIPF